MKPTRLETPSSMVPRLPMVIMVIVVREYSGRKRTTGIASLVVVFASVNIIVVFMSCIWKVHWGYSSCVPIWYIRAFRVISSSVKSHVVSLQ